MSRKIILFTSILLLITFGTFAQNGFLRGKVIDKKSGETLIGVTIFVEGTTMGTLTDFDGNYSMPIPAGTYTIRISYISYQTQTFPDIVIKDGEVTLLNTNLEDAATQLNAVVVTAKARQNTETALLVMQKKSASMLDGISAKQISRLGDDNAAAALKRVTGVSVQDDKYVFVRGLGDRYTKITMNGADVPALDPEKNTVQVDIFPSNIIENIVVHKTFTPDLPGESTGGHVDIVTKDFPENFTLTASASFGFNPQTNLNDEFLSYDGGNTDWLGLDDGTRDIPSIAQSYLDQYGSTQYPTYLSAAEANQMSEAFNKEMEPKNTNSFLNQSYKFSVGNQVPIKKRTLGYNIAISYSNSYSYFDNGEYGLYQEGFQPDPWKVFDTVRSGSNKVNLAGLINLNLKINSKNKVGFRYLRNQAGKKNALYRSGYFFYEHRDDYDRSLGYLQRIFDSYQIHGKHVFPKINKSIATWLVSYTNMNQNEPDLRFFENLADAKYFEIKTNDQPARFYREMSESNLNVKADFEIPINIMGNQSKIKAGGLYALKNRILDETKFELNVQRSLYPRGMTISEFLTNYIISTDSLVGWYYLADQNQDNNNSYEADQTIGAAYLMIDWPIVERLRLIAGLRVEYTDMKVTNNIDKNDTKYKSGGFDKWDPLPSLNLIYKVTDEMNLRLAGSQTIARPAFREIGTNYYDYKLGIFVQGNQDLKRALITNIDLRWEWFFKRGEKLALSGFYKHFQDPIEQKLSATTQNFEIKYVNTDETDLYGFEFEFRKKLDFIGFLRDFSFGGNFTYVHSVVKLTEDELAKRRIGDPDAEDTRPMIGQAPYVVNAYLGYENDSISLESNIGFNVTGEKLLLITQGSTPYIFEQPYPSLNFNINKGIGKHFTLELSVDNILDPKYEAVHHFDSGDRYYVRYSLGRTYKLGIKYHIN